MMEVPQPVDREIEGMLAGVEQRQAGWVRFAILEDGNQYPTKVDTKKPELVNAAMALMSNRVRAAIREQQSTTINPHTNAPYTNRYLNEISAVDVALGVRPVQTTNDAPATNVNVPTTTGQQPLMGLDKDLNIARQCASKVVAMLAAGGKLPPEQVTPQGLVEACEVWMAYYFYGPHRFGAQPFAQEDMTEPVGGDAFYGRMSDEDPGPQPGQYESLGA